MSPVRIDTTSHESHLECDHRLQFRVPLGLFEYDRIDVYDHVLLWRVPLIALIATTTLPALGWHTQVFTVLHLIADPIDTLWSLFYKLDLARRHADWAAKRNRDANMSNGNATFSRRPARVYRPGLEESNVPRHGRQKNFSVNLSLQERLRKEEDKSVERFDSEVIACIVNAYQEWNYGDQAKQVLDHGLSKGPHIARGQRIYWITFAKDFILTSGAIIALTFSAIGVFNGCNCWTKWFPDYSGGQRYLSFPEEQFVFDTFRRRLKYEFAIVTDVALGLELLIFVLVWLYFHHGSAVLSQRDLEAIVMRVSWRKRFADGIRDLFWVGRNSGASPTNREGKEPANSGTTSGRGGENNRDDNDHTDTSAVPLQVMLPRDCRTDTSSLEVPARSSYRRTHFFNRDRIWENLGKY